MNNRTRTLLAVAWLGCCLIAVDALGDDWPSWRGPTGQGRCSETELPIEWSTTTNIRWKVPLPDAGNGSPIVCGDRVFITQASEKTLWPPQRDPKIPKGTSGGGAAVAEKRSLMCFDRTNGKLLWERHTVLAP